MSYTKHYSTLTTTVADPARKGALEADGPPRVGGGSVPPADRPAMGPEDGGEHVDITFTATTSASGSLLIGSSREFSGWSSEPSADIVDAVMERAAIFLPALAAVPRPKGPDVRVGLRPYAVGGLPLIGPVPGLPGFIVAAGHEGSGLCLGPATASLVCQYLLDDRAAGDELKIEHFKDLLPAERLKTLL